MIRVDLIKPLADHLAAHARDRGDQTALADVHRAVTYAELAHRTGRLAGQLAALGLRRGDRSLIYLGNRIEAAECYLLLVRAGAIGVPVNPLSSEAEVRHVLDDSGASAVLVDRMRLATLRRVLAGRPAGDAPLVVVVDTDPDAGLDSDLGSGEYSYRQLLAAEPAHPPRDDLGLDDDAWILYTSGTTGRPKGVLSTQRHALWSVAAGYAPAFQLSSSDRILWPLPMFHSFSHVLCVVGTTALGATTRIMPGFAASDLIEALRAEPHTVLVGVPTLYHHLVKAVGDGELAVPSLRLCVTAGAVTPAALRDQVERVLGVPLIDSYGSTETSGAITSNLLFGPRPGGSCGLPIPGVSIRLVDPHDGHEVVAPGAEGEVWVSGPNVMRGYYRRPAETEKALPAGWYRTGDLAHRDGQGFLFITGRVAELIIRGGENIHPHEIEEVLRGVDGVADAAAAAEDDTELGQVPVAYVEFREGETPDADRILAACRRALSYYKVPERVYAVSSIPRTGSGKIIRRRLPEQSPRLLVDLRSTRTATQPPASEQPATPDAGAGADLRRRLAETPAPRRLAVLVDLVCQEAAAVLGGTALAAGTAFGEHGLDSVRAVALRDRLARATGVPLPSTVAFDYPTPERLATYLAGPLGLRAAETTGPAPAGPAPAGAADEPIAIVAMSCRFPGGVAGPEDLWRLVSAGGEAISPFPTDRGWRLPELFDDDPDRPGHSYVRTGGFLHDGHEFDAGLFGISPREALAMDPQQRLLLEACWELFERAGIPPLSLSGSRTGVFVGMFYHDYPLAVRDVPAQVEGYLITGAAGSVASGRLAYVFGLEGPAITVDTACSSSLVAVHLAGQALRRGECAMAVAGGVTFMSTPASFIEFSRQRGLAADGRCKAFSARADGTAWSEGVGLLLLERLSDARARGHPVLALIRGSAVNSDGTSNGLTAPSGPAQQRVIREALREARLAPGDVDVVEAHGTGTPLGDAIEAQALLATYGQGRPAESPLWIGSLKSNIGHAQAAAGVGGVIKLVQAMRHGQLPKTLHADPVTSEVDWSAGAVRPLTETRPWPAGDRPRRAGVSSFGISGTNAHLILQEAPPAEAATASRTRPTVPGVPVWPLSARGEATLTAQAARLSDFVAAHPEVDAVDIGYSLGAGRSALEHRAVAIGDRAALVSALDALATAGGPGSRAGGLVRGEVSPGKTAFLFTGQGSQWTGMGEDLYRAYPLFAEAFDEVCAAMDAHLPLPLRDVVFDSGHQDLLDRTRFTQPALFALEVALFRLVSAWGLRADYLVGHSVGELAAAHVSGVLSLADACALVADRARLMDRLPAGGAMAAVAASPDEMAEDLAGLEHAVRIAAVNGPNAVVISGDDEAVAGLAATWRDRGRRVSRLAVSHAFHSPRMAPMVEEFRRLVEKLTFHPPSIPIVATATDGDGGEPDDRIASAEYWVRQVLGTVRFHDGMCRLAAEGVTRFLELGPDATLTTLAGDCLASEPAGHRCSVAPALRRRRSGVETLAHAVARMWVNGADVDWTAYYAGCGATRVDLPTYAFQRRRYWPEPDRPAGAAPGSLYRVEWRALPADAPPATPRRIAVLGSDTPDVVDALAREGLPAEAVPDWATLRARITGGQRYDDVLLPLRAPDRAGGDVASTAHECASTALGAARHWLGDECYTPTRLVVVTRGVEQVRPDDGNPPLAAALGLLRSAQTENPGRVLLLDLDHQRDVPWRTLLRPADEPRMAVRDGQVLVPRLVPASAGPPPTEKAAFNGLVVVVGGTGAVGRVVSRHLARRYGVRYLLLLGRRGAGAPEADRLHTELTELGVDVTIRACDAADRDALAAVLDEARQRAPLCAVFHLGGVIDDGVLPSLTPERLDRVLRPKVDAAWHLHELTRTDDLAAFVLFSSISGVLGNAGQGSYAAANAFLDALAGYRRGLGLPGTALAWGMWAERAGMTRDLSDADLHRIRRTGIAPLASPDALALLDAALAATEPVLVPAALGLDALRRQGGRVPGLLRALVDPVGAPAVEPAARRESPLDLVRDSAATVLGHGQAADVPLDMSFRDLGFDSLMTVELRNRLAEATGLRLAAGITVEHPTPRRLAEHLTALAGQTTAAAPAPVQPSTLVDLFARACATGSVADGMAMLGTAARLRETFEQPPEQWRANAVRSLARGADHPVLICIPSYTAVSGPHEYEQFAASLDGGRDVLAVALPGFSAGEPLPASIPALVSALTAVVADATAGRPFVLLGRSSGGWLANAVAERMGGTGQLAGLVLVDTFPPAEGQARLPTLMRRIMAYGPENAVLHDAAVTAMGHYFHLFAQWRPAAVDAPTLLVRATEPYDPSLSPASTNWRASWVFPHEVRDIAGDHFTILEQAAAQTAAAVHDWLREIG